MAKDKMNNPYEEEFDEETFTISRRAMWRMVIAFVLVCLNPPLWRNVFEATKGKDGWVPVTEFFKKAPDETLTGHLKKYEKELEDADFTKWPRREMQKGLTAVFGAGNRKAVIGKDGWVYFQPALDGMTGYGPVTPEPDSVAKDPNREPWNGPTEVIKGFAEQLREFGVELVLIPVPVKPMIYPEGLTGKPAAGPAMHPDAAKFYESLENVTVIDVTDELWKLKESEQVFLKQDTHWTPEGMEFVAKKIASEVRARAWFAGAGSDPSRYELLPPEARSAIGDLVEKLGVLPKIDGYVPQAGFELETVRVQRVIDTQSGKAPVTDVESPVVLLGDSFVNIYSAEGDLHWGAGAGFGEHLAKELGLPVDVIAINGQAATGVRERLAKRPNSAGMMKRKKIVVWAVAARDLFMSETTARSNDVKWEDVEFNDQEAAEPSKAGDVTVVEAEMTLKSAIPDPNKVPYNDALYGAEYIVKSVVSGSAEIAEGETLNVIHWGFKEKVMSAESKYEVGDMRMLYLADFSTKAELQQTQLENEAGFAPTIWFDEGQKTEAVAAPAEGSVATANSVCVIVSLLVAMGLLSVGRRKS